jgi:hypothetical protein
VAAIARTGNATCIASILAFIELSSRLAALIGLAGLFLNVT